MDNLLFLNLRMTIQAVLSLVVIDQLHPQSPLSSQLKTVE